MKTIATVLCLLALVIWSGKTAFDKAEQKVVSIQTDKQISQGSDTLYNMLPSASDAAAIAPAAGDEASQ